MSGRRPQTRINRRWFWLVGALVCVGTIAFLPKITKWLPGYAVFWLKQVSFLVTAALGIVGFIANFKDAKGKLTQLGKINLAGLAFVAAIGITVQTAEYNNNKKATDDAQKQIADLKGQNKTLLVQVERGLEPIGNTITLRYTVMIPFSQENLAGVEAQLQNQMRQLTSASPLSSSGDTYVKHISQPPPDRYIATFNDKSPLMPTIEYQRAYLSQPPFDVSLYLKPPPPLPGCANLPPQPDVEFAWDAASTAQRTPDNFNDSARWKGVTVIYSTTNNYLFQSAEGVLQIRNNNAQVVSLVDLSQSYVRLHSRIQRKIEFKDLTVVIGQRSFALPQAQLASDDCGVLIYRLPIIGPPNS
jgi:hypothetical protein